jgi:hypothetical protein
MVPYLEVLQPLSERGHKVTVVTDNDASAWLVPSYPQFELQFVPEVVNELMHDIRRGNSSMAREMMDPNRRGQQHHRAVEGSLPQFSLAAINILPDTWVMC